MNTIYPQSGKVRFGIIRSASYPAGQSGNWGWEDAPAGIALEPWDNELGIGTPAMFNRVHVSSIWINPGDPADSAALRIAA